MVLSVVIASLPAAAIDKKDLVIYHVSLSSFRTLLRNNY